MIVIGLTGSIGMGKTTLARQLMALGAKICHADVIVHELLDTGGEAVAVVAKTFPGTENKSKIDRKKLGEIVFNNKKKLKQLEALLHPLVVGKENEFVTRQLMLGAKMAVLDIPLLFETGAEARCDITIVASAPGFIQRQRVMKRPNMTPEKFRSIVAAQMSDGEKKDRADFVVSTGLGRAYSFRALLEIVRAIHA